MQMSNIIRLALAGSLAVAALNKHQHMDHVPEPHYEAAITMIVSYPCHGAITGSY